ncbi:hypothetical protein [Luteolibacter pohnpeiensis]|uniref:hypothetical protein n=1 Tax=Luteolibacter pohnpeiensis TaxID=454153 RepID=UPI001903C4B7|nr:hypothetical protein [Luteolibacter pohnpeiensis]
MELSEWVAVLSSTVSFATLTIVILELRLGRLQSKASALIEVHGKIERLVAIGLDKPELLEAISIGPPEKEALRSYLQLWLNQIELTYRLRAFGLYSKPYWESMELDISDFMTLPQMQTHWSNHCQYYPHDFREFLEKCQKQAFEAEPQTAEAPPETTQASTT